MRVFSFLVLMLMITSCDKFSLTKKQPLQVVDTIIDFTAVDTFPSFSVCDSIIDKTEKSDCFRTTIHRKIGEELQKYKLSIIDAVDETVFVDVIINADGKIIFEAFQSSENIKKELPELDSIIQLSIAKLPKIHAAIKRGIPVTTKYQLPIRIYLKE